MIGGRNEDIIYVDGVECMSLIDTGSQVTTLSEGFLKKHFPHKEVMPCSKLFNIEGAGGAAIPYLGYCIASVEDSSRGSPITAPLLVTADTHYSDTVPVILGTNILQRWMPHNPNGSSLSPLTMAFRAIRKMEQHLDKSEGVYGTAYLQRTTVLDPGETLLVHGDIRLTIPVPRSVALVQSIAGHLPKNAFITPALIGIKNGINTVPVELTNSGDSKMLINQGTRLCNLHSANIVDNDNDASRFDISQFDLEGVPPDHLPSMEQLLQKWNSVFSHGPLDLGCTDVVKHRIELEDETPFKERSRPIPPNMFQEVKQHIQQLLDIDVLRPSSSPWSSNVVLVKKKDGSLRLCVDFRRLNKQVKKDSYSIPTIEELLNNLKGATFFTSLDLSYGYHQVEIEEQHKERTAFSISSIGFFEYNRMPFGLTNAPGCFQRLMDTVLDGINRSKCLVYLDDIIIMSCTPEEHVQILDEVMSRLHAAGLKLKPPKCHFMKRKIAYLGHIVSENGLECDPRLTDPVRTWPTPKDQKTLLQFLGFTGFYRKFIEGYASIARPLTQLLGGPKKSSKQAKKNKDKEKKPVKEYSPAETPEWRWGPEQQQAFEELKRCLTSPPILALPDFELPFLLRTDASRQGLGAILYQQQDGHYRVIAYASRALSKAEQNYSAHRLEFLALKWAVTVKYHAYLCGKEFIIHTDHNPLTYLLTTAKLDATGHNWLSQLANYTFRVIYKPGRSNIDADSLSRRPVSEEVEEEFTPEMFTALTDKLLYDDEDGAAICLTVQQMPLESQGEVTAIVDWQEAQKQDVSLARALELVAAGFNRSELSSEDPAVARLVLEPLEVVDGILYRRSKTFQQVVVPLKWRQKVFAILHEDMGHLGRDRVLHLARERFYWPGMAKEIELRIQQCHRCLRSKHPHLSHKAPLKSIITSEPLQLVCMDYLGLETSKGGYNYMLVITDHFTKYAVAIPTRNQSAVTTARVLIQHFIQPFGLPSRIHSDQGGAFESHIIKHLCEELGIQKSRTTPYHPQGDGITERFNRTLLGMLRTLDEKEKADWKSHVGSLVQAYNSTLHHSTGFTPYYLMFGRHPKLPVDMLLGLNKETTTQSTPQSYGEKVQRSLQETYKAAISATEAAARRMQKLYNKGVRGANPQPGDVVLVRKLGFKGKHKLANKWEEEPYKVLRKPCMDSPVYVVRRLDDEGPERTLHRNHLLPICIPLPATPDRTVKHKKKVTNHSTVNQPDQPESDEDYFNEHNSWALDIDLTRKNEQSKLPSTSHPEGPHLSESIGSPESSHTGNHQEVSDLEVFQEMVDPEEYKEVMVEIESDQEQQADDITSEVDDSNNQQASDQTAEDSTVLEEDQPTEIDPPLRRSTRQKKEPDRLMYQAMLLSNTWKEKAGYLEGLLYKFSAHQDAIMNALLYLIVKCSETFPS